MAVPLAPGRFSGTSPTEHFGLALPCNLGDLDRRKEFVMPSELPVCCPYLFYDDLPSAIEFLKRAFGLEERRVERSDGGKVEHAQLGLGTGVVMLGGTGSWSGYRPRKSPESLGGLNAGVYLFVADADAHASVARAAGAKVLMEPADMPWGDRLYCAEDLEGQFWMFATRPA